MLLTKISLYNIAAYKFNQILIEPIIKKKQLEAKNLKNQLLKK